MSERIEDYGPIGDLHTMALVSRAGSIDWLCLPRFDSGACFARLLGDEDAGFWQIGPAAGGPCTRRHYHGDSLVLETEWETPDGTVRLIDFMPPRDNAADVVRIVEGVSGRVPMRMELRLRFDYGHIVPWVRRHGGEQLSAIAGPDAIWLDTPAPLEGRDMTTVSEFAVGEGERVPFVLTHHPSHEPAPGRRDAGKILDRTFDFWQQWISNIEYEGSWEEPVHRSLITLKALSYEPTGGIVAAATTSLPEQLGGIRNWDYRFCWLRDATFTLQALLGTGYVKEAGAWRDWLLRAVAGDPADLQIMYGIDGTRRLTEYEVDWLAGYEGSRPVRIGNAAVRPVPARRVGRGARRPARGPDGGDDAGEPGVGPPARPDRLPRGALAGPGQQPVGGARAPAGLRPLQGHGVGRHRPGGAGRRAVRARRAAGPVEGAARADPHRGLRQGLRRRPRHLHPVLRLPGPRRRPPAPAPGGLPAVGRRPDRRHGRRRAARARRGRLRAALPA